MCEYDEHRLMAIRLRVWMEQVAEEYGYHKAQHDAMIDHAAWTGYPTRSIPTIDEAHPHEPPPVIGHHVKRRRVA